MYCLIGMHCLGEELSYELTEGVTPNGELFDDVCERHRNCY